MRMLAAAKELDAVSQALVLVAVLVLVLVAVLVALVLGSLSVRLMHLRHQRRRVSVPGWALVLARVMSIQDRQLTVMGTGVR